MSKKVKLLAATALVLALLVGTMSIFAGAATIRLGDVDDNDVVTTADARLILRHAVRLETLSDDALVAANVDQDPEGTVSTSDARLALRIAVKLDEERFLEVEDPTEPTEPTEPAPTEPAPTEPTEPAPTEPAPTDPVEPPVEFLPDDGDIGSVDVGDLD